MTPDTAAAEARLRRALNKKLPFDIQAHVDLDTLTAELARLRARPVVAYIVTRKPDAEEWEEGITPQPTLMWSPLRDGSRNQPLTLADTTEQGTT